MDESNKNRRFFFITTLKKNLSTEEFRSWFADAGQLDKFNEKFLFIDSNVDCVIDHLTSELIDEIPSDIQNTDECKSFISFVTLVKELNDKVGMNFINNIKGDLHSQIEPNFRNLVQEKLKDEFATVDDRIYAIKTNKRWQWLGKLYPAVFTRDKQIIFMSMNKFLVRNNPIVEPSYLFYTSDIINNAIIFIDEFDATKETVLSKTVWDLSFGLNN